MILAFEWLSTAVMVSDQSHDGVRVAETSQN